MRIHRFEIGTSGVLSLVCVYRKNCTDSMQHMLVVATPSSSALRILKLDYTIDKLSLPPRPRIMRKIL